MIYRNWADGWPKKKPRPNTRPGLSAGTRVPGRWGLETGLDASVHRLHIRSVDALTLINRSDFHQTLVKSVSPATGNLFGPCLGFIFG